MAEEEDKPNEMGLRMHRPCRRNGGDLYRDVVASHVKAPLSAMKTSAALAKKTGQETLIDRWYRSVQNPLFNPLVMISRLPILTMLNRGFFETRRNGCIDLLPARSNDLWMDLVIASRLEPISKLRAGVDPL
jgi:hypothetical protein